MKTILVVDDENDIAEALQAVLETEGYQVETCCNGEECVAWMQHRQPDLILLDIMMPRLDGFGVLAHFKQAGVDTPVLMMSAIRPAAQMQEYGDMLAGFMKKPFELDHLLDTVERILER